MLLSIQVKESCQENNMHYVAILDGKLFGNSFAHAFYMIMNEIRKGWKLNLFFSINVPQSFFF